MHKDKKDIEVKKADKIEKEDVEISAEKSEIAEPVLPKKNVDIKSVLLIVLALLMIFLVVEAVLLYGFKKDDNAFVRAMGSVFPFPMAVVEMQPVYMSSYWGELDLIMRTCEEAGTDCQITQKDKIDVSNNLIMEKAILELASSYGVEISDERLNEEFDKIIQDNGGEVELKKILTEKYDWSVKEFRYRVYISLLAQEMEESLIEKISAKHLLVKTEFEASEEDVEKAKEKAQEALDKINEGEDFDAVVKEYSEDETTIESGGDLGYFARGVMIPEFENVAFGLAPGQVSGLVKTDFGWHIIKMVDKKGEVKQVFMDWLEEQKDSMRIWRLFDVGEVEVAQQ